jgi:hypothetical protein
MVRPNPDLKTLLADLQNSDGFIRSDAARLLAHIKDPQVVDAFITLLSDPDWRTRRNAAQALGVQKDRRAVEPLIAALTDPIETVRVRAAVALGRIGDQCAMLPLAQAFLTIKSHGFEVEVVNAMEKFGSAIIPSLIEILPVVAQYKTKLTIDLLAGLAKSPEGDEYLRQALSGGDALTRQMIVKVLVRMNETGMAPILITLLSGAELDEQMVLVQALGQLKAKEAIPALLALLREPELDGPHGDLYRKITLAIQQMAEMPPVILRLLQSNWLGLDFQPGNTKKMKELFDALARSSKNEQAFFQAVAAHPRIVKQGYQDWPGMRAILRVSVGPLSSKWQREQVLFLNDFIHSSPPAGQIAGLLTLPWCNSEGAFPLLLEGVEQKDPNIRQAAEWGFAALTATLQEQRQVYKQVQERFIVKNRAG